MVDLGKKHECPSCNAKFYDMGRAERVCPKCGSTVAEEDELKKLRRRPPAALDLDEPDKVDEDADDEEEDVPEVDAIAPTAKITIANDDDDDEEEDDDDDDEEVVVEDLAEVIEDFDDEDDDDEDDDDDDEEEDDDD